MKRDEKVQEKGRWKETKKSETETPQPPRDKRT